MRFSALITIITFQYHSFILQFHQGDHPGDLAADGKGLSGPIGWHTDTSYGLHAAVSVLINLSTYDI